MKLALVVIYYALKQQIKNCTIKFIPQDELHSFETRVGCLRRLRRVGFQVGTGVMIGLPGQTEEDLVNDILFYRDMDIDMIGMGPYVVHHDTPLRAKRHSYGHR